MSEEMDLTQDSPEDPALNGTATIKAKSALSLLKEVNKNKSFIKGYVTDGGILLLRETRRGNVDKVVDLLCRGVPFISDSTGVSPLHFAAYNNSVEITELLLNGGILRDLKNKVDRTSLHIAAQMNHVGVLKTLLTYGADPDVTDMVKMTPLHWAAEYGNVECVKLLLKYKAKVGMIDNFGRTPLDLAKNDIVVKLFENYSTSFKTTGKTQENSSEFNVICIEQDGEKNVDIIDISNEMEDDFSLKQSNDSEDLPSNEELCSEGNTLPPIDPLPQSFASNDKDPLELLKEHGIQMLEPDKITTVRSAVESGQRVVLTEAGKLVLNSTKKREQFKTNFPLNACFNESVVLVQNGKKCIKIHKNRLTKFQLEHDRSFLKTMSPSSSFRNFKGKHYSEEEDEQLKLQLQASISKLRSEAKLLDIFSKRKFRQANLYQQQLLSLIKFKDIKNDQTSEAPQV